MRISLVAGLAVAILTTTFPADAGSDPCGEAGPLEVTGRREETGSGVSVVLNWPPSSEVRGSGVILSSPPSPFPALHRDYTVERREASAGDDAWTWTRSGAYQDHEANGWGARDTFLPEERGRTWSYRVTYWFTYATRCVQDDGFQRHRAPESAVLTFDVPPDPSRSGARNVVAVANTKQPRVRVTWDPPEGAKPESYIVERRAVASAPSKGGPRAAGDGEFVELARLAAKLETYLDKTPSADQVYEYRIRTVLNSGILSSDANAAYPVGRIPVAELQPWNQTWSFDSEGTRLYFEQPPQRGSFPVQAWGAISDETGNQFQISIPAPTRGPAATLATGRGRVEAVAATKPSWVLGVAAGAPCVFQLDLRPASPFDSDAWRKLAAKLVFPTGGVKIVEFTASNETLTADTRLHATVGAAKDRVKAGKRVVVAFQCAALGPNPLYARRASVEATVDDGVIVSSNTGEFFERTGEDGGATGNFTLGALGSDKRGRTQVATLLLLLEAGGDADEMSCTFRWRDDPAAPFATIQPLSFVQEFRRVEVKVDR